MELMHRLGVEKGENNFERYMNDYLELIKKHKGSCDNVWFPTCYGFPKMNVHKENAELIKRYAERFRELGISVSLQLSNSIGHGLYMSSSDCTGLVYDGSDVENMVGPDGVVAGYSFCWNGKNFKKYLLEELKIYCEAVQPKCLWIDDDFRATNHAPVEVGCFCDDCILRFNKKYGTDFTREELVQNILYGDAEYRKNYVDFVRTGMSQLMTEMCEVIHEYSPNTQVGTQYAAYGAYVGFGFKHIFDAIKNTTGMAPCTRPGGGAYNDHNPNEIIEKGMYTNWANAMLPDYVECKCPEIENLPFTAFAKSHEGTAFETSYYFANGNTDMSYSLVMHFNEPPKYYEKAFKLFAEQRGYWEKMSECNKTSHQSGLQYFMSENIWAKHIDNTDDVNTAFKEMNREVFDGAKLWLRDAIPVCWDRVDDSVILLHPETAKDLSRDEIEYLLSKNVITDGESIDILRKKGYDIGIDVKKISVQDELVITEELCEHMVNPKGADKYKSSFFTPGSSLSYYIIPKKDDVEIIGRYMPSVPLKPYMDNDKLPYGAAEVILTTSKGKKWAVTAYEPWKGVITLAKRDRILNIADYISGNALAARLDSPIAAVLLPRKNKDGKTVSVSISSCVIGTNEDVKLTIRNPKNENFVFMSQHMGETKLEYTKIGNDYHVVIPRIEGWSVGTVFCDTDMVLDR